MADVDGSRARYRRIMRFATRYMIQAWWYELFLPRFGLERISALGRRRRLRAIARDFHGLALGLGGLMIKVGQFMSSRLDILPPEITKELEGLQDEVPAVAFPAMKEQAERELGMPLERAYAFVDPVPLAAASLGQAHRVRLLPADADEAGFADAVVKIQRPGIDRIVEVDLRALRTVAARLNRVQVIRKHVDLPTLVEEFAYTSLQEIDYLHEAQNAERFDLGFAGDRRVTVPDVVWERTTRRVLTLQDVSAIKISDVDALRAAGIDPAEVATAFANVMFDQLFVDGYFHADPHPGNIFITPLPGAPAGSPAWRFSFVDFGMMGEVSDRLREGLQRLIIAVAARDSRRMVEGVREVGVLLPSADTAELERALSALFARFGGMGFAELQRVDPREFRDFAREFGDTVRAMPFQLPENFLLIIRAISLTSGMCSSLDPEFNIWNAVEPYAQQLLRDQSGSAVQAVVREVADAAGIAARLPRRLDGLVSRAEEGRLQVDSPRLDQRLRGLERTGRRVVSAALFTGLVISGAVLRPEEPVFGTLLMVASIPPLLHAVFAGVAGRPRG